MGHAFTGIRDAVEAVGSLVGNYVLPGSSLITDNLVSDGAKRDLGSTVGKIAQVGSGVAGGLAGNLSNYGNIASAVTGSSAAPAAPTIATSAPAISGIGSAPSIVAAPSVGSSLSDSILGTGASSAGNLASVTDPVLSQILATSAPASASSSALGTLKNVASGVGDALSSPAVRGLESAAAFAVPTILAGKEIQNQANLQGQALKEQNQAVNTVAQPASNVGEQALQQYAAGTISAPQQSSIDQFTQQAQAQVKQAYANMGLSGSSQEASALAQVDQQAQTQKQQYVQQNFSNAMSALGLSAQVYGGISQSQLQTSQGMQQALAALGQALGGASTATAASSAAAA